MLPPSLAGTEQRSTPAAPGEKAQKPSNRNDADAVAGSKSDDFRITFEVVVPGHEVPRPAVDGGLEQFVIVGITAHPQPAGHGHDIRPGRDQTNV